MVAVGGKAFVAGFVLSGVSGEYVSTSGEALGKIENLVRDPQVGLNGQRRDRQAPRNATDGHKGTKGNTANLRSPGSGK